MAAFVQSVIAHNPLLWLDDTDYAADLLARGTVAWLDIADYVAWRRRAQQLFKSHVVALPVGRVCAAWLANDASLKASMSAKSRVNHALKTLLAAAGLRRHLVDLAAALRASFPALPLALVCPSPRAWVRDAFAAACGAAAVAVGEEEVDAATLHCADFLREFGAGGIDAVLLEESADSEPSTDAEVEWYRSVWNVGGHYRWDMGLRVPGRRFAGAPAGSVSYLIAPQPTGAPQRGAEVPAEFWRGDDYATPPADFIFAALPRGLAPEAVLDRLARLRDSCKH